MHDAWGKQNSEERGLSTQQSVDFGDTGPEHVACSTHQLHSRISSIVSLALYLFLWKQMWVPSWGRSLRAPLPPRQAALPGWTALITASVKPGHHVQHTALKGTPNVISLMVKLCTRKQIPGKHLTCRAYRQQVLLHDIYSN